MDIEALIPPALLTALTALKPQLEVQGVIQQHRKLYRVRYRAVAEDGSRVHKSIPIGDDPVIAEAVRTLIESWREIRQALVDEEKRNREAERQLKRKRTLECRLLCALSGSGQQRRRQVRDFYWSLHGDPLKMVQFARTGKLPDPPRAGRPRKQIWGSAGHPPKLDLGDYLDNLPCVQRYRAARADAAIISSPAPTSIDPDNRAAP